MKKLTSSLGFLLIILGLASYFGTGQASVTALIPAFFGVVFVVLAMIASVENLNKHMMHAAAGIALIGLLGAARGIPGLISIIGGETVERPLAIYAQVAMFIMCALYIFKAIQSFRVARKNGDI